MKKTFFSRYAQLQLVIIFAMLPALKISAQSKIIKDPDVIGRWDLTIQKDGKSLPSWLEVQKSGLHVLVGRFTYAGGSARPISEIMAANGKYTFSIPPQWEDSQRNLDFEFEVNGNAMQGTMVYVDGVTCKFTGVRAPALIRDKPPALQRERPYRLACRR